VAGRVLTLGGRAVPASVGFATPSDGDVLSHALIDALAGAIGKGDMGRYFPGDADPAAQGARSLDYVRRMRDIVIAEGLAVEHVDSLVTVGTVPIDLDFGLYWDRPTVMRRDVHDLHKQLERIAKEVGRWRPSLGRGLLTVTPAEVDKRGADLLERHEEIHTGQDRGDGEVPDEGQQKPGQQ
jgi:hypothetical protein